jgi:hypothetical protein
MKTNKSVVEQDFLTSALSRCEFSVSHPGHFTSGNRSNSQQTCKGKLIENVINYKRMWRDKVGRERFFLFNDTVIR